MNMPLCNFKTVRRKVRPDCPPPVLFARFPFSIFSLFSLFRLVPAIAGGFIRCKSLLPRLIRRLEVYFLQILPFCESVIGRKSRRMKLSRQPCTASIKSQAVLAEKEPSKGKNKKRQLGNGRTNHLAAKHFILCYTFTQSVALARIAKLSQEHTAHSSLLTLQ